MESEYVEENNTDKVNNDDVSKPSLQQTISFSQNNNESDNSPIQEDEEMNEEVSIFMLIIQYSNAVIQG